LLIIHTFSTLCLPWFSWNLMYSQWIYSNTLAIQIHSNFSHDYIVIIILSNINVINLLQCITLILCNADHYSVFFLLTKIIYRWNKMTELFLLTWKIPPDRETIVEVIYNTVSEFRACLRGNQVRRGKRSWSLALVRTNLM